MSKQVLASQLLYPVLKTKTKKDPLLHTSSILKPGINGKKGSNLVVNNSDYLF